MKVLILIGALVELLGSVQSKNMPAPPEMVTPDKYVKMSKTKVESGLAKMFKDLKKVATTDALKQMLAVAEKETQSESFEEKKGILFKGDQLVNLASQMIVDEDRGGKKGYMISTLTTLVQLPVAVIPPPGSTAVSTLITLGMGFLDADGKLGSSLGEKVGTNSLLGSSAAYLALYGYPFFKPLPETRPPDCLALITGLLEEYLRRSQYEDLAQDASGVKYEMSQILTFLMAMLQTPVGDWTSHDFQVVSPDSASKGTQMQGKMMHYIKKGVKDPKQGEYVKSVICAAAEMHLFQTILRTTYQYISSQNPSGSKAQAKAWPAIMEQASKSLMDTIKFLKEPTPKTAHLISTFNFETEGECLMRLYDMGIDLYKDQVSLVGRRLMIENVERDDGYLDMIKMHFGGGFDPMPKLSFSASSASETPEGVAIIMVTDRMPPNSKGEQMPVRFGYCRMLTQLQDKKIYTLGKISESEAGYKKPYIGTVYPDTTEADMRLIRMKVGREYQWYWKAGGCVTAGAGSTGSESIASTIDLVKGWLNEDCTTKSVADNSYARWRLYDVDQRKYI